jgi:3-dehydroquinate synthase
LESLPLQEIKSGLMETVKHALINDPEIFDYILENRQQILAIDKPTLQYLITKSVQTKTAIVTLDEFEKGERKKLNLGHTIGHAIESTEGIPHGYAIAIGMVMTAKISHQLGFCSIETVNKISELISSFGLATDSKTPTHQLIEMIKKDKKKQEGSIDFICIKNIGEVFIQPMTIEELNQNIELIR